MIVTEILTRTRIRSHRQAGSDRRTLTPTIYRRSTREMHSNLSRLVRSRHPQIIPSRDVAAVVGCENTTAFAISSGVPILPSGTAVESILSVPRPPPRGQQLAQSWRVDEAWLIAFTRMRGPLSFAHDRANERARFVACKHYQANPLLAT